MILFKLHHTQALVFKIKIIKSNDVPSQSMSVTINIIAVHQVVYTSRISLLYSYLQKDKKMQNFSLIFQSHAHRKSCKYNYDILDLTPRLCFITSTAVGYKYFFLNLFSDSNSRGFVINFLSNPRMIETLNELPLTQVLMTSLLAYHKICLDSL